MGSIGENMLESAQKRCTNHALDFGPRNTNLMINALGEKNAETLANRVQKATFSRSGNKQGFVLRRPLKMEMAILMMRNTNCTTEFW